VYHVQAFTATVEVLKVLHMGFMADNVAQGYVFL
jgi:hypothetical protein